MTESDFCGGADTRGGGSRNESRSETRVMKIVHLSIAGLLNGLLALVLLSGCASTNASNHESLLNAAGFRETTPQTTKQRELYAEAPAYHVQSLNFKGHSVYVYKDEGKGVVWIGGDKEYQRYRQLAMQQRAAQENYVAAQMNAEMATGWIGAYGPWAWGPNYY